MPKTDTNLTKLIINVLSQEQYNLLDEPSDTELYMTPDTTLYRSIGEIVTSAIPLTDIGLHLLDGSLLNGTGIYSDFVDYICKTYKDTAVPNATLSDNLTNDDGIISGFTKNDYITLSSEFTATSTPWEINTKIITGNVVSGTEYSQTIWGSLNATTKCIHVGITNAHFSLNLGDGTTWSSITSAIEGMYIVQSNTEYWLKVTWTGSVYTVYYSLDGINYLPDITFNSTKAIGSYTPVFGAFGDSSEDHRFMGAIDLNEVVIKSNGKVLQRGVSAPWVIEESDWQTAVTTYGTCGKFVINDGNKFYAWLYSEGGQQSYVYTLSSIPKLGDSVYFMNDNIPDNSLGIIVTNVQENSISFDINNHQYTSIREIGKDIDKRSVRLPKISGILEGTLNANDLGSLVEAGLPNIKGAVSNLVMQSSSVYFSYSGAFYNANIGGASMKPASTTQVDTNVDNIGLDASRSSSVYGKSKKVQPQTTKVFYYIVVANATKSNYGANLDNMFEELSGVRNEVAAVNTQVNDVTTEMMQANSQLINLQTDFNTWVETIDESISNILENLDTIQEKVSSSKIIGEIITSTIPLSDPGLHLLDGSVLQENGIYKNFIQYINKIYNELPKIPNVNFIGNVINTEGVLSNFSADNYARLPLNFDVSQGDTWEMVWEVTTGDDITTQQYFLGTDIATTYSDPIVIGIYNNNFGVYLNYDDGGHNADLSITSDFVIQTNTTYIIKVIFTGDSYSLYINGDLIDTVNSSTPIWASSLIIGAECGSSNLLRQWLGSVNLENCYININNKRWWDGKLPIGFTNETIWQEISTQYSNCGKFVYDPENNTVRLPKITGIIEGTTDMTSLGDIIQAGLPNITGTVHNQAAMQYSPSSVDGAFYKISNGNYCNANYMASSTAGVYGFDASRSSSIYGKSDTVQPQTIKVLYYIVIANSISDEVSIDVTQIVTDLNMANSDITALQTNVSNIQDSISSILTEIEDIQTQSVSRNIGEIITSTIPINEPGLHLLDGSIIFASEGYSDFVSYIANLRDTYPDLFLDDLTWQETITQYGSCGKFVYNSTNNTVRLPKITGIVEGTTNLTALGDLVQAGLPNITGGFNVTNWGQGSDVSGAFYQSGTLNSYRGGSYNDATQVISIDASRSSSIYGNSSTVQPQTVKVLYYIVIANNNVNTASFDIEQAITSMQQKTNTLSKSYIIETYVNGSSWYRIWSDGFIEQGGLNTGNKVIELLVNFSDTNYTIVATINGYASGNQQIVALGTKTVSSFRAATSTTTAFGALSFAWYACGY